MAISDLRPDARVSGGVQGRGVGNAVLAGLALRDVVVDLVGIVVALALAADLLVAEGPQQRAVLLGHHRGEVVGRALAGLDVGHPVGAIARGGQRSTRAGPGEERQAESQKSEPGEAHFLS